MTLQQMIREAGLKTTGSSLVIFGQQAIPFARKLVHYMRIAEVLTFYSEFPEPGRETVVIKNGGDGVWVYALAAGWPDHQVSHFAAQATQHIFAENRQQGMLHASKEDDHAIRLGITDAGWPSVIRPGVFLNAKVAPAPQHKASKKKTKAPLYLPGTREYVQ